MTSLLCLPVVVYNLGVEMLYVLEQRLRAQSVTDFKAVKVLHDVTRAMFAPEFVNELFTPQPTYSQYATRKLFDKLAHTSIMRLSESSMDKLYDLMTMGFKFQLATCEKPEDILNVTLLHLATLKSYLTEEAVIDAVDAVDAELRATYGAFAQHEWLALRRGLFRFLGNKRIKVSLLLHEKLQLEDGRVRLPVSEPETRSRSVVGPVGTTRRHDIAGSEQKRTFHSAFSFDDARDAEKGSRARLRPRSRRAGTCTRATSRPPSRPRPSRRWRRPSWTAKALRGAAPRGTRTATSAAGRRGRGGPDGGGGGARVAEWPRGDECARRVDPRADERERRRVRGGERRGHVQAEPVRGSRGRIRERRRRRRRRRQRRRERFGVPRRCGNWEQSLRLDGRDEEFRG